MGLIFKNANQKIELAIKGYEFPTLSNCYWDNNWLVLSCRSTIGEMSTYGEFPCFMTMELERLKLLLEQYQAGEQSTVQWGGTEPNFTVSLHKNRLLEIYFFAEKEGHTVTFRKYAETEDVAKLIDFCADSLRQYPIRKFGTR